VLLGGALIILSINFRVNFATMSLEK